MGKGPQSFNVHGPLADLLRHWLPMARFRTEPPPANNLPSITPQSSLHEGCLRLETKYFSAERKQCFVIIKALYARVGTL